MVAIAPSILSADFYKLGEEIALAEKGGAEYIHVDVMDGHFVPNITIGPLVVKSLKKKVSLPLDTHLMISDPEFYIPRFAEAGSDIITVHIETCPDIVRVVNYIKSLGVKAGVTLNPATPFDAIMPALPFVDLLLIMTVQPGFGAQQFMYDQLVKIENAKKEKMANGYEYSIEVDGGINRDTISKASAAGGEIMVAGNAVFGGGDIISNIRLLKGLI